MGMGICMNIIIINPITVAVGYLQGLPSQIKPMTAAIGYLRWLPADTNPITATVEYLGGLPGNINMYEYNDNKPYHSRRWILTRVAGPN